MQAWISSDCDGDISTDFINPDHIQIFNNINNKKTPLFGEFLEEL